jgi:uncharacterized protein YbjT (DUF2867 family)
VLKDEEITLSRGGTEVHGADVARVVWKLLTLPDMRHETFHLSDLYVTTQEVVRLARQFADRPGPLPPAPPNPPENMLVCRRLEALGLSLGGLPLLEATIAEMVRAAQGSNPREAHIFSLSWLLCISGSNS